MKLSGLQSLTGQQVGGRVGDFSSLAVAGAHGGGQMGLKDTKEALCRVECGLM